MPVDLKGAAERLLRERAAAGTRELAPEELFPPKLLYPLSVYDRVPPAMFWNMLTLLGEMYEELLAHDPERTRVSDETLLLRLQDPPAKRTAWDNPIFEALHDALHATEGRAPQGRASTL